MFQNAGDECQPSIERTNYRPDAISGLATTWERSLRVLSRRIRRKRGTSEWAYEHQVVQPPEGKPVIDSYGKLLLVLHREADGNWRVTREMWNQGMKP